MPQPCRLIAIVILLILALTPPAGTAPPQRVVAVGDVHGNFDGLVAILHRAGLINMSRAWTGGDTVLVQTGDFSDRGPRVRAVMDLLLSLQAGAKKAGGQVHVLLGNHEGMNLLNEMRDVSRDTLTEFVDSRSEQRRNEQYDHQRSRSPRDCALRRASSKADRRRLGESCLHARRFHLSSFIFHLSSFIFHFSFVSASVIVRPQAETVRRTLL